MFNNPLDSFHNTVAEAKEERERLDRLLTISTPRERLLVAAIGLVMLILAAWLFLGTVSRSLTVDGTLLGAGGGSAEVMVWVARDASASIVAGTPATIEVATTDGEMATLRGTVSTIGAQTVTVGPVALRTPPTSVYQVTIGLDEELGVRALVGQECRVVFELDGQSPVALLGLNRT